MKSMSVLLKDHRLCIYVYSQKYMNPSFTIYSVKPLKQQIIIFVNYDNLIKVTFRFVVL